MIFGKNYDEKINEISRIINLQDEINNNNVKFIKDLHELFDSIQESMITMAKVQAQHKAIITFLVNHVTVDSDAQEDLTKMMQEIIRVEKDVGKELKKNKENQK